MQPIIILENTFYTVLSLRMEIMHYFKSKGYPIYVLSTGPKEDMDKLNQLGYQTIDVGSVVMHPIKALKYFFSLVREIKKINPEIIFSFTIRPNIFGSIVARILSKRIVSNVTGTGPLIIDNSWLYKTIRLVYKFAFTTNQCVFFQNKDDYSYFLENKYVKESQAKLLPGSGVDTSYYLPIEKNQNLPFTFLMISRLIKDKGVIEYIVAAREVKKQFPEVKFQLLGPFWTQSIGKNTISKQEIDSWVAEGIIDYLGYTNDVRPYIASADCIVLPSYREGCANVLMQGASMERPVIASDVTGCNNLIEVEKSGYVFPVRHVEKLVLSLLKMINLSPEERKTMGQLGRQKMINEYQKSIVLEAYELEVSCNK
jgi:glycosyltransferase involved in cell wall biosynthesis